MIYTQETIVTELSQQQILQIRIANLIDETHRLRRANVRLKRACLCWYQMAQEAQDEQVRLVRVPVGAIGKDGINWNGR